MRRHVFGNRSIDAGYVGNDSRLIKLSYLIQEGPMYGCKRPKLILGSKRHMDFLNGRLILDHKSGRLCPEAAEFEEVAGMTVVIVKGLPASEIHALNQRLTIIQGMLEPMDGG